MEEPVQSTIADTINSKAKAKANHSTIQPTTTGQFIVPAEAEFSGTRYSKLTAPEKPPGQ